MEKLIIVGLSTNARHVYEFVKNYNLFEIIGFAVDKEYRDTETFKDLPVYELETLEDHFDKDDVKLFIALLWNRLNADRRNLFERLTAKGWKLANLISPYSRIRGCIQGSNVWVHDYVVIQNDAVIGDNVAIMAHSIVGADCIIGNHCFLGANCTVGGGSTVGEQCFIGIKCTVFDQTAVGKKCILGACTAVKRNVPDYTLVKTSSDIQIKTYSETEIEEKLLFRKNVR